MSLNVLFRLVFTALYCLFTWDLYDVMQRIVIRKSIKNHRKLSRKFVRRELAGLLTSADIGEHISAMESAKFRRALVSRKPYELIGYTMDNESKSAEYAGKGQFFSTTVRGIPFSSYILQQGHNFDHLSPCILTESKCANGTANSFQTKLDARLQELEAKKQKQTLASGRFHIEVPENVEEQSYISNITNVLWKINLCGTAHNKLFTFCLQTHECGITPAITASIAGKLFGHDWIDQRAIRDEYIKQLFPLKGLRLLGNHNKFIRNLQPPLTYADPFSRHRTCYLIPKHHILGDNSSDINTQSCDDLFFEMVPKPAYQTCSYTVTHYASSVIVSNATSTFRFRAVSHVMLVFDTHAVVPVTSDLITVSRKNALYKLIYSFNRKAPVSELRQWGAWLVYGISSITGVPGCRIKVALQPQRCSDINATMSSEDSAVTPVLQDAKKVSRPCFCAFST